MIEAIRPMPETSDQIAPPIRSVSGEKRTRAPAPINGPRKTYFTGSGRAYPSMSNFAAAPAPETTLSLPAPYRLDISRPNWAARPEKVPKVMM